MLGLPLGGQPLSDDGVSTNSASATGVASAAATFTGTGVFSGTAAGSSTTTNSLLGSALFDASNTADSTTTATITFSKSGLFRLGYINGVQIGSLTASTAESNLPVSNLSDPGGSASVAWQTTNTSLTNQWFKLDIGENLSIGAFILARTNLTSAATIRWRIFTDNTYTTALYDSGTVNAGVLPGIGMSVVIGGVNGQFVQCDINDSTNPDSHINIPQAWVGPLFAPTVGLAQNSSLGTTTGATITQSKFGQSLVHDYWQARQWTMTLNFVYGSEWPDFQDLDIAAKDGSTNILFIPNVGSGNLARDVILGTGNLQAIGFSATDRNARSVTMTITERL